MIGKNTHYYAVAVTVFLLTQASSLFALSMGPIKVKSDFGEQFHAEIELAVEKGEDVEVIIGTQKDYDRLQVDRLKIVDKLHIDKRIKVSEGKEVVKIVSEIPLFFPSFNLVVRVSQNGGSLLENYLITVDFQQTVSLAGPAVKKDKKGKRQEVSPKKQVNLLKKTQTDEPSIAKENIQAQAVRETPRPTLPKKITAVRDQKHIDTKLKIKAPTSVAQIDPTLTRQQKFPTNKTVNLPVPVIIPSQSSSSISHASRFLKPKYFSKLKTGKPKFISKRQKIQEKPVASADPKNISGESVVQLSSESHKILSLSGIYGPLSDGETLSKIAAKFKINSTSKTKIAVAIWLDNGEQFIGGNIHGIKTGAVLNMKNVRKRLEQLSEKIAHIILRNHWQEWKIIKAKLSNPVEEEESTIIQGVFLPAEKLSDKADVFRLLEKWRHSWENEDINQHMSYFSKWFRVTKAGRKRLDYADWKEFKLRMFNYHNQVKVHIHRPKLIQMGDRVTVSFDQSFDSHRLNSFGHKVLELAHESEGWKIISEQFELKPSAERGNLSKLVIHASSHGRFNQARNVVNQLRQRGFNAYFAPLNLTQDKKIYRVFVERFSDWTLASRMARSMRSWKFSRYAIPVPIPFSLLAGSFALEDRAAERVEFLRKNGVSSFLYSTSNRDFSNPIFNVMVGAYGQKKETRGVRRQLTELGISFRLIAS